MADVFISHASDDKEVVRPLVAALTRHGLEVWFDETALGPGDSLTESVDEGLAQCRFGVIVLSPSYFTRGWTREELRGLRIRQLAGERVIIPVWHEVTKADVRAFSLPLADLVAIPMQLGAEQVADLIVRQVRDEPAGEAAWQSFSPSTDSRLQGHYAQVRDLAPSLLIGREEELRDLAAFCAGGEWYRRLEAPPWAGKTALTSSFAIDPPDGIDIVSFFLTAGLAGQNDGAGFTETLIAQLAPIAGEAVPAGGGPRSWAERDAERRRLLDAAAAASAGRGRRLLLLVDALDEDRGVHSELGLPSIASLLPRRRQDGLLVLTTSRPHPQLPPDVPADHPLRSHAPTTLSASPHAADLAAMAKRELFEQLRKPGVQVDVVGFLCAAGDALTLGELAELTGQPRYLLMPKIDSAFGRSLAARHGADRPQPAFSLAHEALREQAIELLADRLPDFGRRLDHWAESYAQAGWPADTPHYLLWSYGQRLIAAREAERLQALATDPGRRERLAEHVRGGAQVLTEIRAAEGFASSGPDPDVEALALLAVHRTKLLARTKALPKQLPMLWAKLGDVDGAEQVARTLPDVDATMASIAAVLADEGRWDDAERIALGISSPKQRSASLRKLVITMVDAERFADSERVCLDVEGERDRIAIATHFAQAERWKSAESILDGVEQGTERDRGLVNLVECLAAAGRPDDAERLLGEVDTPHLLAWGLLAVGKAMVATDPAAAGERAAAAVAAQIPKPVLSRSNEVPANTVIDLLWASGRQEEAERFALDSSHIAGPHRLRQIARLRADGGAFDSARHWALDLASPGARVECLLAVMAASPPEAAAAIATDLEASIAGLRDSGSRDRARVELAAAVAPTSVDRALQLLEASKESTHEKSALAPAETLLNTAWSMRDTAPEPRGLAAEIAQAARAYLRDNGWRVPRHLVDRGERERRLGLARAAHRLLDESPPSPRRSSLLDRLADAYLEIEAWDDLSQVLSVLQAEGFRPWWDHRPPHEPGVSHSVRDILAMARRTWEQARMDDAAAVEDVSAMLASCEGDPDWTRSYLMHVCAGEWDQARDIVLALRNYEREDAIEQLSRWNAMVGRWDDAEHLARMLPDAGNAGYALCALCRIAAAAQLWEPAARVSGSMTGVSASRALTAITKEAARNGAPEQVERALAAIDDDFSRAEALVAALRASGDRSGTVVDEWVLRLVELSEQLPGDLWRARLLVSSLDAVDRDSAGALAAAAERACRRVDDPQLRLDALAELALTRDGRPDDATGAEVPLSKPPSRWDKEGFEPPLAVLRALADQGRYEDVGRLLLDGPDGTGALAELIKSPGPLDLEPLTGLGERLVGSADGQADGPAINRMIDAFASRDRWDAAQRIVAAFGGSESYNPPAEHLLQAQIDAGRLDDATANPFLSQRMAAGQREDLLTALVDAGRLDEVRRLAAKGGAPQTLASALAANGRTEEAEAVADGISNPGARVDALASIAWKAAAIAPAEARRLAGRAARESRGTELPSGVVADLAVAVAALDHELAGDLAVAAVEAGYGAPSNRQEKIAQLMYGHGRADLAGVFLFARSWRSWNPHVLAGLVALERDRPDDMPGSVATRAADLVEAAPTSAARAAVLAELGAALIAGPTGEDAGRELLRLALESAAAEAEPARQASALLSCSRLQARLGGDEATELIERAHSLAGDLPPGPARTKGLAEVAATLVAIELPRRAYDLAAALAASERPRVFAAMAREAVRVDPSAASRLAAASVRCSRDLRSEQERSKVLVGLGLDIARLDVRLASELVDSGQLHDEDWTANVSLAMDLWKEGRTADAWHIFASIPGDFRLEDEFATAARELLREGNWERAAEAVGELREGAERDRASVGLAAALAAAGRWEEAGKTLDETPAGDARARLLRLQVALHTSCSDEERALVRREARSAVAETLTGGDWTAAFGLLAEIDLPVAIAVGRELLAPHRPQGAAAAA
jgi:tetratricopeptide (TPR) repeat protein